MPSSITLTVSHLAQSTSFFLSALQPLGYIYRGRACSSTIAFGPADTSVPPDFWLTQSTPAVPAGAAHVAFAARSREAVQGFFRAALQAGATIHGEPCVRDSQGYYSGAIIDFDGNSIEAVYRPSDQPRTEAVTDACSVVSRRSQSRAPSAVSRVPLGSQTDSNNGDRTFATGLQNQREPIKRDALDTIVAQARSAADVAKQLVDSVRPGLSSSTSTPTVPSQKNIRNKDAFAKAVDPTNAVMGTILGVAAGAAVTYAIASRNSSSSAANDSSGHEYRFRDKRPSLARSATEPRLHPTALGRRSEHANSRDIALLDNDKRSIATDSTIKPDVKSRRRGSFDSAIGVSATPSAFTARSSRATKQRMIEAAPPPSAYKAPAGALSTASHSRSRSKNRATVDSDHHNSNTPSNTRHRSRSESRSRNTAAGRHGRHDSGYSATGFETILHIKTHQAYGSLPPNSIPATPSDKQKEKENDGKRWSSNKTVSLGSDNAGLDDERDNGRSKRSSSRARSKVSTVTAQGNTRNADSRRSGRDTPSLVSARSALHSRRDSRREGDQNTVIGKMRDLRSLKVRDAEVRPEDSVSQAG